MIEKHWRGVTSRTVCDFFWEEVNKYDSREVRCDFFLILHLLNLTSLSGNATCRCNLEVLLDKHLSRGFVYGRGNYWGNPTAIGD